MKVNQVRQEIKNYLYRFKHWNERKLLPKQAPLEAIYLVTYTEAGTNDNHVTNGSM
jgi:hypothetical protein